MLWFNWTFKLGFFINVKDLITFQKYNLVPIGKIFKSIKFKLKNKILHIGGDVVSKGYLESLKIKINFISPTI